MSKIPTAEKFISNAHDISMENIHYFMIEFAKLHVEACKKQFKIVFNEIDDPYPFEKKDKLKDVYPLENVK